MSHTRQNIRDALVTIIQNGNTAAGSNVYPNRETLLWESELPAVLVYTKEETADPRSLSGSQSIRTLEMVIEAKVMATENVDDDIDDLCAEIEDLLSANPSLSGNALSCIYKSTNIDLDSSSENQKGTAILTYQVKYIR